MIQNICNEQKKTKNNKQENMSPISLDNKNESYGADPSLCMLQTYGDVVTEDEEVWCWFQ